MRSGNFSFPNVPFNPYHLTVTAAGFASYAQDIEVRSSVPLDLKIALKWPEERRRSRSKAAAILSKTILRLTPIWTASLFQKASA